MSNRKFGADRRSETVALSILVIALAGCTGVSATVGADATTRVASPPATSGVTAAPAATHSVAATAVAAVATATTKAQASAPTAEPAPVTGSARDAVIAAMRKQLTVGPYRSKSVITSDKTNMDIVGEVIPPDRMHVTSTTAGGRVSEQIYIGNRGWSRIGTGAWTAANSAVISMTMSQISGASLAEMESIVTDVKTAGADTVEGAKTLVYTYIADMSKAATPMAFQSTVRVWINETTGLIVKIETNGTVAGVTSKTVQTVVYDPTINIEPPK